jgi:tight adherence protein C
MSDPQLILVLAAAGVAALLGGSALWRLVASVPAADRRWHDRPPLLWRLGAPLTRVLAAVAGPLLPPRWRNAQSRLLRQAGLDLALDAAELVAGRLLAAVLLALFAWTVGAAIPPDGWGGATVVGLAGNHPARELGGDGWGWWSLAMLGAFSIGWLMPASWVSERRTARLRAIGRTLPFYLDVITLSVESGTNLTGALQHAVAKGPPGPLQVELERVLRDVRAGRTRADSLRAMSERLDLPAVASWVGALVAAERHGSSLGPILRAQAEQRRQERFQHAEKLAMKAPVKMLFPLLVFFFPCTFVLLFFPVAVRLLQEGLLR